MGHRFTRIESIRDPIIILRMAKKGRAGKRAKAGSAVNTPEWRQFEQLVARIEQALAPQGAVVTSPDKVVDLTTGGLREVDASIRYVVGSVPILITVECRDRAGSEDVTWIEQLGTKRLHVGAATTIAVSSRGFSPNAVAKAPLAGIDLRRIEEIDAEVILDWLKLPKVSAQAIEYTILKTPQARCGELVSVHLSPAPVGSFLYRISDGGEASIEDVVGNFREQLMALVDEHLVTTKHYVTCTLSATKPEPPMFAYADGVPRHVDAIEIDIKLQARETEIPYTYAASYDAPEGQVFARVAQGTAEINHPINEKIQGISQLPIRSMLAIRLRFDDLVRGKYRIQLLDPSSPVTAANLLIEVIPDLSAEGAHAAHPRRGACAEDVS